MADAFYVSIVGQQGKFAADGGEAKGFAGKIRGLAFHYEVTSPRDSATGQTTGRRQHSPVTFVKEWGASSPQLVTAALTDELLPSVLFEFVATSPEGKEEIFHTIKLTDASIASIKQDAKGTVAGHDLQDLEEISFVFRSIEMENVAGKTRAVDDWGVKGSRIGSTSRIETGQIAVQEPYAGLAVESEAPASKLTAPRTLLSRIPSASG